MTPLPGFLHAMVPVALAAAPVGGGRHNAVPAAMRTQDADLWCWAAVTQTVEGCRGATVDQSEVATGHVSRGQPAVVCTPSDSVDGQVLCGDPCQGACNSPHILSQVLAERGLLAAPARRVLPAFQDVVDAIDQRKPLPVRLQPNGEDGGHFICVVGYAEDGSGARFIDVLDPLVPGVNQGPASLRHVPFDTFVGGGYRFNGASATPNFIYDVKVVP